MNSTAAAAIGPISPDVLYPLAEAKKRLGWGAHSMRMARRAGLRVRYVHKRAYLSGADIIAYIEQAASV